MCRKGFLNWMALSYLVSWYLKYEVILEGVENDKLRQYLTQCWWFWICLLFILILLFTNNGTYLAPRVFLFITRELKQRRRRKLRERHLKSELAQPWIFSRLFHLSLFVKCWQFFFKLNSKGLYQSSGKEKKVVVLRSRPRQNVKFGTFTLKSSNDG